MKEQASDTPSIETCEDFRGLAGGASEFVEGL
jgi:hypothetical protein